MFRGYRRNPLQRFAYCLYN